MLHVIFTALAVGIAFSLPVAAQYILYQWWPLVASDATLLLATEISLAASLAVLFNLWRVASENRVKGRVADTAALACPIPERTAPFAWRVSTGQR